MLPCQHKSNMDDAIAEASIRAFEAIKGAAPENFSYHDWTPQHSVILATKVLEAICDKHEELGTEDLERTRLTFDSINEALRAGKRGKNILFAHATRDYDKAVEMLQLLSDTLLAYELNAEEERSWPWHRPPMCSALAPFQNNQESVTRAAILLLAQDTITFRKNVERWGGGEENRQKTILAMSAAEVSVRGRVETVSFGDMGSSIFRDHFEMGIKDFTLSVFAVGHVTANGTLMSEKTKEILALIGALRNTKHTPYDSTISLDYILNGPISVRSWYIRNVLAWADRSTGEDILSQLESAYQENENDRKIILTVLSGQYEDHETVMSAIKEFDESSLLQQLRQFFNEHAYNMTSVTSMIETHGQAYEEYVFASSAVLALLESDPRIGPDSLSLMEDVKRAAQRRLTTPDFELPKPHFRKLNHIRELRETMQNDKHTFEKPNGAPLCTQMGSEVVLEAAGVKYRVLKDDTKGLRLQGGGCRRRIARFMKRGAKLGPYQFQVDLTSYNLNEHTSLEDIIHIGLQSKDLNVVRWFLGFIQDYCNVEEGSSSFFRAIVGKDRKKPHNVVVTTPLPAVLVHNVEIATDGKDPFLVYGDDSCAMRIEIEEDGSLSVGEVERLSEFKPRLKRCTWKYEDNTTWIGYV